MSTRLQAVAVAALVTFTGIFYWFERPFRTPASPNHAHVEEILGRDPGDAEHTYWGPGRILWTRVKVFVQDWNLPIPVGMYFIPSGDVWTYRFPTDSTYTPASDPLDCDVRPKIRDATLYCRYMTQRDGQRWTYTLSKTTDEDSALFVVRISAPGE
jgi:hypothetical protein